MIDRTKLCWQKFFTVDLDLLPGLGDLLASLASEYSHFVIKNVIVSGNLAYVLVEEFGHPYPYCHNKINIWIDENLKKKPCKHEPVLRMMGIMEALEKTDDKLEFECKHCNSKIRATGWEVVEG